MTGAIDPFENDADAGVDAPQVSLSTARSSLTQFEGPEWETWPFNFIYQSYLLTQKPWRDALNSVDGVRPREKHVASIATRQVLDMMSPANFVWSNPKVIARTISEGGANLMRGAWNLAEDWQRAAWVCLRSVPVIMSLCQSQSNKGPNTRRKKGPLRLMFCSALARVLII